METVDEKQIEKLLEDITSIKEVISDNKPLLRQMLLPIHFRVIALIAGVAIIGLSALYYILIAQYDSYDLIPSYLQMIALGMVAVVWLAVAVLKRILWMKSMKQIDSSYTFGKLIRNLYSYQILHLWVPIMLSTLLLSLYFYYLGIPRYIVTTAAFSLGIVYNSIGSMTRITQYMLTGYWMIVTSALPLLFPDVSALIFLALSIGCAMLIFLLTSGTSNQRQE
jgi:hypothetical protein